MQKMNVTELIPHPQNDYYFDDIQGQKWTEFLESVKTSGVIEPIICNQNKVVISGHQRLRACKELGINEVLVDTRIYDDEQKELKDLIETNIRQRGDINSSGLKLGRIIRTLEEFYGIQHGGNRVSKLNNVQLGTQEDIASQLGMDTRSYANYKKLTTLIPELQELSLEGNITTSVASRVLARLSQEEQLELFNELGEDKLKEMTQKEVKEYIDKNNKLEQELRVEKNKPKEVVTETIDNTDYTLINKIKAEKRDLELKVIQLQDKVSNNNITYKDSPETISQINRLNERIRQKDIQIQESELLKQELNEKRILVSKFIGENTNIDLISTTSNNRKKMMDFVQDMSKYDYLSESFNDIPDATRKEWVKAIYGVFKWSKSILEVVKHDDVIGVDTNIIDADYNIN